MRLYGYVAGVGHAVLRGGRYDELVGKYGTPAPATGFSVDVEALAAAEADNHGNAFWSPKGVLVAGPAEDWQRSATIARSLRRSGIRAAADLAASRTDGALYAYAAECGFSKVMIVEKDSARMSTGEEIDAQALSSALLGDGSVLAQALGEK
jgi:ATP phosphoribosyltransferase regulatory subunit